MRQNWLLFPKAIAEETCNELVEAYCKLPGKKATVFNDDSNIRNSIVRWISDDEEMQDLILRLANRANDQAFNVNLARTVSEIQFTEYSYEYQGKYDIHHDVDWNNQYNYDRKLSVVIQLSDPSSYKGGGFYFHEVESPSSELAKQQGSVLVFPSYLTHAVSTVTEGVRHSIVSWVWGPRWR